MAALAGAALAAHVPAHAWRHVVGSGRGNAVAVDAAGDVLAAGVSGLSSSARFQVVKLAGETGTELWRTEVVGDFGTSFAEEANAVAVDGSGDVIAVGSLYFAGAGRDRDMAIVKLDGATGSELWRTGIDGALDGGMGSVDLDTGLAALATPSGNVIAGGTIDNGSGSNKEEVAVVVMLDGTTGAVLWRTEISGSDVSVLNGFADVATDGAGDVVALGRLANVTTGLDLVAVKLDGATGAVLWRRDLSGAGDPSPDGASRVVIDTAGDVLVTGHVVNAGPSTDLAVFKLAGSTGADVWQFDLPNGAARAAAIDGAGDVIVTGQLLGSTSRLVVSKLAGATGTEIWRHESDGGTRNGGVGTSVLLDGNGDIIATGMFDNRGTLGDIAVVKLDPAGTLQWTQSIGDRRSDAATAAALHSSGDLLLAAQLGPPPPIHSSNVSFGVLRLSSLDGALGPVAGRRLVVRDVEGDPSRRRMTGRARDQAFATPPPGSTGDPTIAGASLQVVNLGTGESATFGIPAGASWRGLGTPPGSRGYRYTDPSGSNGPCTKLEARPGRLTWKCSGRRGTVPFTLDEPSQGTLVTTLRLGAGAPQCTEFGGTVLRDQGTTGPGSIGLFKARDALPFSGDCP